MTAGSGWPGNSVRATEGIDYIGQSTCTVTAGSGWPGNSVMATEDIDYIGQSTCTVTACECRHA